MGKMKKKVVATKPKAKAVVAKVSRSAVIRDLIKKGLSDEKIVVVLSKQFRLSQIKAKSSVYDVRWTLKNPSVTKAAVPTAVVKELVTAN